MYPCQCGFDTTIQLGDVTFRGSWVKSMSTVLLFAIHSEFLFQIKKLWT